MNKETNKAETEFNFRELNTFAKICIADGTTEEKFNKKWPIDKFSLDTIGYEKNKMIYRVINHGWIADYKDRTQKKWYAISYVSASGVGFVNSGTYCAHAHTDVGVRLYAQSQEKLRFIIEYFEKERIEFLL
jgi:hypothetical protein